MKEIAWESEISRTARRSSEDMKVVPVCSVTAVATSTYVTDGASDSAAVAVLRTMPQRRQKAPLSLYISVFLCVVSLFVPSLHLLSF